MTKAKGTRSLGATEAPMERGSASMMMPRMAEQSFSRDDEAVDDDSEDDDVNQDEDGIADAILAFAALALESTREVS